MAPLPPREQRQPFLMYQGLEYSDRDIANFEERQKGDAGGVAEEAMVASRGGDEDEEMPQAVPPPPRT
nr:hypothetical protein [Tanacetum cinerariifolium]